MLYLATRDNKYLSVDEREIRREGKSFTVDTLASIRDEIGTQCPLFLVLGADAYALVDDWFAWQTLTDLAHIVVLERPGHHLQATSDRVKKWSKDKVVSDSHCLARVPAGAICRLKLTQIDISSTKIRELIRRDGTIDDLLPQEVIQYIREHHLYGKDPV